MCNDGEVILMEEAYFGRMQLGKCVSKNYGSIGCATNAQSVLDARCSGRQHCRFVVADPDVGLLGTSPCPKDFASYLQVAFRCQSVFTCTRDQCDSAKFLHLTAPEGYLANIITTNHGCGSTPCPWVIEVLPGQKINVTLLDFSLHHNSTNKIRHRQPHSLYCAEYALIRETQVPRTTTICGGDVREKPIYVSSTNKIEIQMQSRKTGRSVDHFVIRYQAIGCPTLPAPANARIQRSEEKVKIICNHTRDSWTMICIGTDWVGESRNCSHNEEWAVEGMVSGIGLPSVGVSILIIFGVALVVVIYIAISIMCVLYFRRHRRRAQAASVMQGQTHLHEGPQRGRPNTDNYEERTPMLLKHSKIYRKNEGDYGDICELQLLNSSLDAKSSAAILKCQRTRSLSVPPDAGIPPGAGVPECCNSNNLNNLADVSLSPNLSSNVPRNLGTFRTFKPVNQPIYECSPGNNVASLGRFPIRPFHPRYHELDVSRLHNCHSSIPRDKLVSAANPPDLHRDIPNEVVEEGRDNETNALKEQI